MHRSSRPSTPDRLRTSGSHCLGLTRRRTRTRLRSRSSTCTRWPASSYIGWWSISQPKRPPSRRPLRVRQCHRGARKLKPYVGPNPPAGTHDYQITLYALDSARAGPVSGRTTLDAFIDAVGRRAIGGAADRKVHEDQEMTVGPARTPVGSARLETSRRRQSEVRCACLTRRSPTGHRCRVGGAQWPQAPPNRSRTTRRSSMGLAGG